MTKICNKVIIKAMVKKPVHCFLYNREECNASDIEESTIEESTIEGSTYEEKIRKQITGRMPYSYHADTDRGTGKCSAAGSDTGSIPGGRTGERNRKQRTGSGICSRGYGRGTDRRNRSSRKQNSCR